MRTSLYSILCIVVRLGAVMLFVETVTSLPAAWASLRIWTQEPSASDDSVRGMLIGFSGASLGFAALLWLYPGVLARMDAGAASREVFESPLSARQLQYIAFSVLGVAFAIKGLAGLVDVSFRVALSTRYGDTTFYRLLWQNGAAVSVQLLEFVIGIGLTFGARGLTGLLHRLRERGLPPPLDDDEPEQPSS